MTVYAVMEDNQTGEGTMDLVTIFSTNEKAVEFIDRMVECEPCRILSVQEEDIDGEWAQPPYFYEVKEVVTGLFQAEIVSRDQYARSVLGKVREHQGRRFKSNEPVRWFSIVVEASSKANALLSAACTITTYKENNP